jgi:hypothetical protein
MLSWSWAKQVLIRLRQSEDPTQTKTTTPWLNHEVFTVGCMIRDEAVTASKVVSLVMSTSFPTQPTPCPSAAPQTT